MKNLFEFEYYIKKGIIKKRRPDKSRAEFLINESKKSFKGLKIRINKLGRDQYGINSIIKEIQGIIIQSLRSKMLLEGLPASVIYAHEAEVAYIKKLKFNEFEIYFVNTLRTSRNGINYYGKIFQEEYARECYEFLINNHKKFRI
jgi:hypothetical protein